MTTKAMKLPRSTSTPTEARHAFASSWGQPGWGHMIDNTLYLYPGNKPGGIAGSASHLMWQESPAYFFEVVDMEWEEYYDGRASAPHRG